MKFGCCTSLWENQILALPDAGAEELPDTAEEGVFAEAAPEEAVTAEE